MNRAILAAALLLCFGTAYAQDNSAAQTNQTQKPAGTKVTEHSREVVVQPKKNKVNPDRDTIKAAQAELKNRGYYNGAEDGIVGPNTQTAINKFQADQQLPQTGRLDASTLSHLNVGGVDIVQAAPGDLARGGKAAGHDIKEGHPVAAGKAAVKGSENFGKKVGKGAKSLAVGTADKVGQGISAIGDKVSNTVTGNDNDTDSNKPSNPPNSSSPQSPNPPQR